MNENPYIKALELTGKLSESAVRDAINYLDLSPQAKVLDIPCGTGLHSLWMLEQYPEILLTGVDISEEHLQYANEKMKQEGKTQSCKFIYGDMNKLDFADNSFDLVWCCNGLWAGSIERGCPAEEPYEILKELKRITKPGGKIAILFWSSQRLFPGYPLLEATLNATSAAVANAHLKMESELHFMRTSAWLEQTGFKNVESKTFSADIQPPFDDTKRDGVMSLFNMFFTNANKEVSKELWDKYQKLTSPESPDSIFKQEGYAGFLTYTMFVGEVV